MALTKAVRIGGIIVLVLLMTVVFSFVGNQRRAYAELPPPDLGSQIVCIVFDTLTQLGDPIPVLTTDDCTNPPSAPAQCVDGIDNDGDGLVDAADPGCADGADNNEFNTTLLTPSACADGIDNDGDGLIDFVPVLGDPGCSDIFDENEGDNPPTPPPPPQAPACSDGIDNDDDDLVDSADPGCSGSSDTDETNTPTGTAQLVVVKIVINDNGGTSTVSDFSLHISTSSPGFAEAIGMSSGATTTVSAGTWFVGEDSVSGYTATFSGECNASGQVTLAGGETKTCYITNNDVAPSALPACSDGADNDGDGLVDSADPGCSGASDSDETNPSGGGVPENPPSSGGGGGGGGGGLSWGTPLFTSTTTGIVLGFSTTTESCDRYLTSFIKAGGNNDADQVKRLQRFLRDFEGAKVSETGIYDGTTLAAVHAFQTKYAAEILAPWGTSKSTGYVYLTTRKKVNEIFCRNTRVFFLTVDELKKIEGARAAGGAQAPAAHAAPKPVPPSPAGLFVPAKASATSARPLPLEDASSGGGLLSPLRNMVDFVRGIFNRSR
ncbi:hypothetical protein A3A39_04945 [Candidatus Kaiserbacteria bacterium RIFCSPLOWO2_01_FULL_54_13]|uniref:SpaA-like prealbumin fold domain-containing protein n=1 Tax=Candidatus Kaiserbacteria bacterium RIFCSPLOWO2_01_FULL_54_13 TaxID=1798512 RepID=A0A1F6F003_9BACT|nr:MAG: hypothetical protein A3A39_04945 [Candidatus Kaiserbacteria bacterium RIFCSPLOWO2_01_FULL_54_13]